MRTNFDFTPYRRSTVGFDRLFDLLEMTVRADHADGFPPYDLEKVSEDSYRITLAVAGFRADEIEITAQQNQLLIAGHKAGDEEGEAGRYLHRKSINCCFLTEQQFVNGVNATFSITYVG